MFSEDTQPLDHPELFIGLVGAVGTDLKSAKRLIDIELARFGYESYLIKVSEYFWDLPPWAGIPLDLPEDQRLEKLMNAGDELRERVGRNDSAILHSLKYVRIKRAELTGSEDEPASRMAFVFHSLKTPEEVETLRSIYGARFLVLSLHSPKRARVNALARKIAATRHTHKSDQHLHFAERFVYRDVIGILENPFGQNIGDTFPRGDFFVDFSTLESLRETLRPFFELLFGHPFITPSRDEHGMFLAFGTSLRSSSLSRQVGAAIANTEGDLLALGTNEVPKAGGGLYWRGDDPDGRDFQVGSQDVSYLMRKNLLANVLDLLVKADWVPKEEAELLSSGMISDEKRRLVVEKYVDVILGANAAENQLLASLRRGLLIQDLIEFHRGVHAEMAALNDAARRGVSVKDAVLFCRTFPCHLCAPHVVAAGISRVVFLEPYPKSLVAEFYDDSIAIDTREPRGVRVSFQPFVGVSPRRYTSFFHAPKRKLPGGEIRHWDERGARPRTDLFSVPTEDALFRRYARVAELRASIEREGVAIAEFNQLFQSSLSDEEKE